MEDITDTPQIDLGSPGEAAGLLATKLRAAAEVYSETEVDSLLQPLVDNQVSGRATYETWAQLVAVTGSAGAGAEVVPSDAGSHTDPVVGGTVLNRGLYKWSTSPAGWKRIGEGLSSKADQTTLASEIATRTDTVAWLQDRTGGLTAGAPFSILHSIPFATKILWGIKGASKKAVAAIDDQLRFIANRFIVPSSGKYEIALDGQVTPHSISHRITDYVWAIIGTSGKIAVALDRSMMLAVHKLQALQSISVLGYISFGDDLARLKARSTDWGWAVVGAHEKPVIGVKDGDVHTAYAGSSARISMLYRDAQNQALARSITQRPHNAPVLVLDAIRQMIILDGQSLGTAQEGWPAKSKTPRSDCFMIGKSVRPQTSGTAAFTPIGSSTLQPLIATVEPQGTRTDVLSDVAVAALTAGDSAEGENSVVAVTNHVAKAWAERGGAPARKWVAAATGVSGKTIEQLSKGASPNLYQRNIDAVTLHKSLADAASETSAVAALLWMQGEWNYDTSHGGDATKTGYKAKLVQLRADLNADIAAVTGQALPASFFTYQTSASFVDDTNQLAIGMAQWEFARENAGCWMVGPIYPVTDKGGHLDPNGYRWFGSLMSKVIRHVLVDRLDWRPLSPLWVEYKAGTVYLGLHVPAPPVQFSLPYVVNTATDFIAKGFRLTDDYGDVAISSVEIVGATVIAIKPARTLQSNPLLWAGSKTTFNGVTCVCDSDGMRSDDLYNYSAGSGDYVAANVVALIDKPYPLNNWLINFCLPIGWTIP